MVGLWQSPGGGRAYGQVSGVTLDIKAEHLGLGGYVRRGSWTPVRLELFNQSPEPLEVVCRWMLRDDDQDKVVAERTATLGSQRDERVWLYANPPWDSSPGSVWTFQVVDANTNQLLTWQEVTVPQPFFIEPNRNMIGVCGIASLGLLPFDRWSSQHEPIHRIEGLSLQTLPDRWYGLASLSALVWCPSEGGDPGDISFTEPMRGALREWVYRGGHLVIVLPQAGQTWTSSGVSDLLAPLQTRDLRQVELEAPSSLFPVRQSTRKVPMIGIDLEEAGGWTPIFQTSPTAEEGAEPDSQPEPVTLIAGRRFGFGQVTLIGMDLSSSAMINTVGGFDMYRLWPRVFGWRVSRTGQIIPDALLDSQDGRRIYNRPGGFQAQVEIGDWIGPRVARQASTGLTLGLAIVLFLLYGGVTLLTFPAVLRGSGMDRHSWLIFIAVIGVFSAVAWGGASLLRPASTSATHFSVMTIDGNTNIVHTRSWVSLFVPRFDAVEVAVPSEPDGVISQPLHNALSSPGLVLQSEDPGYPDTQTYAYDSAQPDRIAFPIRATTKQFVADFVGQITGPREGLEKTWSLPLAEVGLGANGLPAGIITHRFDQPLTDVVVVYCPGGSGPVGDDTWKPLVWQYVNASNQKTWAPNDPLVLPGTRVDAQLLWTPPRAGARDFTIEGYLGNVVHTRNRIAGGSGDGDLVKDLALLSFFDAIPPPTFEKITGSSYWTYHRSMMRDIDLTKLLTGRRLIVIGHLREGRAPMPLLVDGEPAPTEGWTVVRWVYDL